jgi:hypothetical protein
MPRLGWIASGIALLLAACESNRVQSDSSGWSSTPPAASQTTAREAQGARPTAPDPVVAPPASEAPAPVAGVVAPYVPQGPMPPPTLRAQLRELEASVDGNDLVLAAELTGEVAGAGELTADQVTLEVQLLGPTGTELVAANGGALHVRLAPRAGESFHAGPVQAHLEGRLPIPDLGLRGEGIHQLVPEMASAPAADITLEPLEQFPYVWITRASDEGGGRNDARVLSARER